MSNHQVIFKCTETNGDFIEVGSEVGTTGKCVVISTYEGAGSGTVYLSRDDARLLSESLVSLLNQLEVAE